MHSLTIVSKAFARRFSSSRFSASSEAFYFSDDYETLVSLRQGVFHTIGLKTLERRYSAVSERIRQDVLEALALLNVEQDSFVWWGGHIASKNVNAVPLVKHIVYFFCALEIMEESLAGDLIFVVESPALIKELTKLAETKGFSVHQAGAVGKIGDYLEAAFFGAKNIVKAGVVLFEFIYLALVYRFYMPRPLNIGPAGGKNILVRTWVTDGNFNSKGQFSERVFPSLVPWLESQGYRVFVLPMFFNMCRPMKDVIPLLVSQFPGLVLPERYLTIFDFVKVVKDALRLSFVRVRHLMVRGHGLFSLVNEVSMKNGFQRHLTSLNAASSILGFLKSKGLKLDKIYYPMEGNAPEKQFILSARKNFPRTQLIGYQHTVYFPSQLTYYLPQMEKNVHPWPDKVVLSGPIYSEFFKENGYPRDRMVLGCNLRFQNIYKFIPQDQITREDVFLLPLGFDKRLACDLFLKIAEVSRKKAGIRWLIRTHSLLPRREVDLLLKKMGVDDFVYADEGSMQDWLPKAKAVMTCGSSVTALEAVVAGVPLIRVVTDNTFYHDCFSVKSYPLEPVHSPREVLECIGKINALLDDPAKVFEHWARETESLFFTPLTPENIKAFL